MDTILTAARETADAIRNSDVYRAYRRSRLRVESQPGLASSLRAYKKAQIAYENKRLRNEPVGFEEEKFVSHLRAELMLNQDTRAFLADEDAFLAVFREVVDIMNNACEIDLFNL